MKSYSASTFLACALAIGLAGSASATPLYFTGPSNFGTQASEVSAAMAADAGLQSVELGGSGLTFSFAGGASLPNPSCESAPNDPTCLDLTVTIPPSIPVDESLNPSKADPTLATSTWQVTNTSGMDLQIAYLVFVSSFGAITGDPLLVGLDPVSADDYEILTFDGGSGFGRIFYAAIDLGPMSQGATKAVAVHYVVADDLIPAGGSTFLLPILNTQALVSPIPEPGAFSLLAAGLVALAAARRRCA